MDWIIDWIMVALIGGLVGTSELVARYRDAPVHALRVPSAGVYILLNAIAAFLALALARVFGWNFGVDPKNIEQLRWTQVLATGFGAMALFRSSLLTIRVGDQSLGIGPISVLQIALGAADRGVDRARAQERATTVQRIMKGISFDKSSYALPTLALALMQNTPAEDQADLRDQIDQLIADQRIKDDYSKALSLGLLIMNIMGPGVLTSAVAALAERIKQGKEGNGTGTPPPARFRGSRDRSPSGPAGPATPMPPTSSGTPPTNTN